MLLVMTTGLAVDGVIDRDQLHRLDSEWDGRGSPATGPAPRSSTAR